jgi:xanthine/CO dehydrogenase XdhC/CoxF family maturation factor
MSWDGYLGAVGSRNMHDRRTKRVGAVESETIRRIEVPFGLNVGAVERRETAVSVCAEVSLVPAVALETL